MDRWVVFIRERFPVFGYLLVGLGITLSSQFLLEKPFSYLSAFFTLLGLTLFFFVYTLMDELKDYDKDRFAYKMRPLPRGLISLDETERSIHILTAGMFLFSLILWALFSWAAFAAYLVTTLYLWNIYREFYVRPWLEKSPFLTALSHQLVVLPLACFAFAMADPAALLGYGSLSYAFLLFGAMFTYEICRKLNPRAHPVLLSYRQYYGLRLTVLYCSATLFISAAAAGAIGLDFLLWPVELAVFVALLLLFFTPNRFRLPQTVAGISLYIHAWSGIIGWILKRV